MATNHVQPGNVIPWTNSTGSAVSAGAVVVIGLFVGVALTDIANGATGSVAIEEVFELPKATGVAFAIGAAVYYDTGDTNCNATAEDNYYAGLAFEAAASAATTVKVKLGAYGLLTNES